MVQLLNSKSASFKLGDTVKIYFPPTGVSGNTPTFPTIQGKVVRVGSDGIVIEWDGRVITFNWDHIAGVQQV